MMMILKLIAILFILETAIFQIGAHSTARIEDKLQSDNAVIKSIQSEDGDIIDCVDIYKQPAFSHPALKNHEIQMKPSYVPTVDITSKKIEKTKGKNKQPKADIPISVLSQLWRKTGSCPDGTIPIRRATTAKNAFGSKESNDSFHHPKKNEYFSKLLYKDHSETILFTLGEAYIGAKADIALGWPEVELDSEYTLSHISLISGSRDNYEAARSGWAVNPGLYGDGQPRLFTYWTVDGSQNTGCFDLTCPGFVHVNNDLALGAAFDSVTSRIGIPPAYSMTVYIHKDPGTDNLWVNYMDGVNIGYFPASLFSLLNHHAETVQWGGDVYSTRVGTHPHTKTGMGSGKYASVLTSGQFRRIRVLRNSLELKYPDWIHTYADEFQCYSYLLEDEDMDQDPEFYYGGPGGRDPRCP